MKLFHAAQSQVIEWKVILLISEIEYEYKSDPFSILLAERYCTSTVLPANLETKVCIRWEQIILS